MIRFMRFLFKSLVTATFAIVAVHFVRVVNIGFAVLRHFKGYGKLNTRIEVPECLSYRQVTAKQRLDKELYTLLFRLAVSAATWMPRCCATAAVCRPMEPVQPRMEMDLTILYSFFPEKCEISENYFCPSRGAAAQQAKPCLFSPEAPGACSPG